MKSKTSFFNMTALKKDVTRYAPIWVFYTIYLLLMLFSMMSSIPAYAAETVVETMPSMLWINLLYAGICAAFLCMDLFHSRLCNGLHAFPVHRESWLTTHIVSGMLFSFVPNLLTSLLACLLMGEFYYIAFLWLAVSTLQFIFFFGTAILAAMCAGNLLGMIAVYGITHLITVLVYYVTVLFYEPLLHGVYFNEEYFFRFFPLGQMGEFDYIEYRTHRVEEEIRGEFMGFLPEQWRYLGICAVFGVVALVLAFLVYRRRHLETAGDLIAWRPLAPVFLTVFAIGSGMILFLFFALFGDVSSFLLIIGISIGYFTGRMLLNRTLKVFTKKVFLGLGVMIAVLAGTLLLTLLDPLGVTRYVPELDKIANVRVIGADKDSYYSSYSPFSSFYWDEVTSPGFAITDQTEITKAQDFHKELIQYRPAADSDILCDVRIVYTLKNGRTVLRNYRVEHDSKLGKQAGAYFSDVRYVFEVSDPEMLYWAFESVSVDAYYDEKNVSVKLTDTQDIAGLIDAVKADCEAGLMAQNWAYHDKYEENYYVHFSANAEILDNTEWGTGRKYLRIWPDCTNTTAYLRQMIDKYPQE